MTKKSVMVSIEDYVHAKAKDKGLNVSAICEDSLRQIVESFESSINQDSCIHKWSLPACVPWGLARDCLKCGKIERVYIETMEETNERLKDIVDEDMELKADMLRKNEDGETRFEE